MIMMFSRLCLAILLSLSGTAAVMAQTNVAYSGSGDPVDCPVDNSGGISAITVADGTRASRAKCVTDLDQFKIDLYKIGICRAAPDSTNPASDWTDKCVFILDLTSALETEITTTSSIDLGSYVDLSTLTEGIYTHAVLLIGNTMYSKMRKQFADTFMGKTSVGSYCYSIDGATYQGPHPTRAQLATECVASEAVMNSNGNHGYMAREQVNFGGSVSKTAGDGANVYLMADASTLATLSGSSSNATRLAGVIAFDTSKVITANTTSVNLGFQLTGQGQVQFSTSSNSGGECNATDRAAADSTSTTTCIKAMRNYGVGFRFTVQ
mgnify:CR=1|jgi:hypothetical protein|tara:strand:+ start:141 stop:1109 length:969 start_codon:yes stop_codon:yes gene_type:complete